MKTCEIVAVRILCELRRWINNKCKVRLSSANFQEFLISLARNETLFGFSFQAEFPLEFCFIFKRKAKFCLAHQIQQPILKVKRLDYQDFFYSSICLKKMTITYKQTRFVLIGQKNCDISGFEVC